MPLLNFSCIINSMGENLLNIKNENIYINIEYKEKNNDLKQI